MSQFKLSTMKNPILKKPGAAITLILTFAFYGCATLAETGQSIIPYPFKTAKIEYNITGNLEGTTTVKIKGNNVSHETIVTGNSEESMVHSMLIETESKLYQINLIEKTGNSSDNPVFKQVEQLPQNRRMDYMSKLATGLSGEDTAANPPIGQKKVAGETCDLYQIRGLGEICLWNSIPLYSMVEIPDKNIKSTTTASSIQTNVEIPDSDFAVPEGITMTEI